MNERSALLVIDQQKGIDHPKLGSRNNPGAEERIQQLMALWRARGWPLIHVRHRSQNPDSVFWPEQSGFDLKPDFEPLDGELLIEKITPCAFTATGLEEALARLQVDSVVIVGVATNNSVEATARTGGCRGLRVTVVEDACFAFARADCYGTRRSARDVHAMSLANLDGEYASVIHSSALLPVSE